MADYLFRFNVTIDEKVVSDLFDATVDAVETEIDAAMGGGFTPADQGRYNFEFVVEDCDASGAYFVTRFIFTAVEDNYRGDVHSFHVEQIREGDG